MNAYQERGPRHVFLKVITQMRRNVIYSMFMIKLAPAQAPVA